MTLVSATILLFVVMDAFGNLPLFVSALDAVPEGRRQKVVVRELLVAFTILVASLFLGPYIMVALQISSSALRIAGGIILFLIAIKMVFGGAPPTSSQLRHIVPYSFSRKAAVSP